MREHRNLRSALNTIEAQLDADIAEHPLSSLAEPMSALKTDLLAHFEWEESSNLFNNLPEERPEYASEIAALKAQHAQMRTELDAVVYTLRSTDGEVRSVEALEALPDRIRGLIVAIRSHEHAETDLLQRAFHIDLGTGD